MCNRGRLAAAPESGRLWRRPVWVVKRSLRGYVDLILTIRPPGPTDTCSGGPFMVGAASDRTVRLCKKAREKLC